MVTPGYFIRMKGLPWHSSVEDVTSFYQGAQIETTWVHIIKMPDGRDSGECLVGIEREEDFHLCMACDKHFMGKRYIELYEASQQEWNRITQRIHRENKIPIDPNSFVILMRGLPYSAQEDDCISFFGGIPCLGVHLSKDRFGRASGQGFAEFPNEENYNAALQLDRSHMQNRYIELFKSSVADLVSAMRLPAEGYKNKRHKNNANASGANNAMIANSPPQGIHPQPQMGPQMHHPQPQMGPQMHHPQPQMHHPQPQMHHPQPQMHHPMHIQNPYAPAPSHPRMPVESREQQNPNNRYIVNILGLPPSISEAGIRLFFEMGDVFPLRIHYNSAAAEAFVEIHDAGELQKAISLSKTRLKEHVVEIYRSSAQEMSQQMGNATKSRPLTNPGGSNFGYQRYAKHFVKKDPGLSLDLEHNGGMGVHDYMNNGGYHGSFHQRRDSPMSAAFAPPSQLSIAPHHSAFPQTRSPSAAFVPPISGSGFATPGLAYPISPTFPYGMPSFTSPGAVIPSNMPEATSPAGGMPFPVYSPSPSLNSFYFPPPGGLTKSAHQTPLLQQSHNYLQVVRKRKANHASHFTPPPTTFTPPPQNIHPRAYTAMPTHLEGSTPTTRLISPLSSMEGSMSTMNAQMASFSGGRPVLLG